MPPIALALLAVAAVMHVAWNVLFKRSGDPLRAAAAGIAFGALAFAPIAFVAWLATGRPPLPAEALGLAVVSGGVEVLFFVLLSAAYRRGDLSVVYPIARGSAPLIAVVVGLTLLGERLPPLGWLGVGLLLAGLLALQRPWRIVRRASLAGARESAVPYAFATGVSIAAYSALDRVATQLTEPWLYGAVLWLIMAGGLVAVVALRGRRRAVAAPEPDVDLRRAAVVGALTLGAYLLVLTALSIAPLAAVAPMRESAIVLASGWGVLRLGEGDGRTDRAARLAAGGLVLLGAVLLGASG